MKIRVKKAAVIVLSILLISIGSISTLAANNNDELHLESTITLYSDEVESLKDGEKNVEPMSNGDTYNDVWLQEKIDAGGNIVLDKDVVLGKTINLPSKSVIIDGGDNKHSIKLAESFKGRHFGGYPSGSNTYTFKNLKIEGHNKSAPGNSNNNRIIGGGIDMMQGTDKMKFIFEDFLITGCHTTSQGGAINLNNPTVILKNTIFENNSATTSGGAIAKNGGGSITINGGEFRNNSAYNGQGGVIAGPKAKIYIDESTFEKNYAKENGGAIAPSGNHFEALEINNSVFEQNKSDANGGAIYTNTQIPTYVYITNCEFIENKAVEGGAVSQFDNESSGVYYKDCSFIGNIASKIGGAIHVYNKKSHQIYLNNIDFSENKAAKDGIYWEVENPRAGPSSLGLAGQYNLVKGSEDTQILPYDKRILNMKGKTYSKAIQEGVIYSNPFNNHDIAYDTEYTVYFYNSNTGDNKFVRFGNNEKVVAPDGFEKFPGFIFRGWKVAYYSDPKFANLGWIPEDWNENIPYMFKQEELTGHVYLLPTWEKAASIVYYLNDGSDKKEYINFEKNTEAEIVSYENVNSTWIAPDGKEFDCWNTKADGSGETYEIGKKFTATEDYLDLYAIWKDEIEPVNEYEIKYFGNGNTDGSVPIDNHKYDLNEDATVLPKGDLIKRDSTFTGWNTKADGSGKSYKPGDVFKIENSVNLYAQWKYDGDTDLDKDKDKDKDYNMDFLMWNWHTEKPIETVIHRAYVNGYPDGSIRPQGEITRGEVAAIIARLHADVEEIVYGVENNYSDVNSTDWYSKHILYVRDKGLMEGYEDGTFKPENKITRAEYVTVVARFKGLVEIDTKFEDSKGHWAEGYIGAVNEKGWISGYPDGTFKPTANITREEVVKMTNGMLGRSVKAEGIEDLNINKFTDLEYGTWSYYEMIEASTSHKCLDNDEPFETWIEIL
ncbi:MAG: hypothetical protein GXZ08_09910 [Tissierellia bacterium]|nr:hypothetical protein [Tissierellia bacterium]